MNTFTNLDSCLEQISKRDEIVHAWSYIDLEGARDQQSAQAAKTTALRLSGLVVGIKDVIDVAGMPTTHGSPIFAKNIPQKDAESVRRLRENGAIILGKTVTAEFATYSPGPTSNPWSKDHTPGGSSSGSAAAVAAHQADIALGTQTAGSVIRPASFCGILGFKPSFGRYSLDGVLETAPNLDTLGLFAKDLDCLDRADAVLASDFSENEPNAELVVGLCKSPSWSNADDQMQAVFEQFGASLSDAGIQTVSIELPAVFDGLSNAQALIHRHEAWKALGHIRQTHPDQVSSVFRDFIDRGSEDSERSYQSALALQMHCKELVPEIFNGVDMFLVAGAKGAAPKGLLATGDPEFQRIWTALGLPCLGFPAGWNAEGLPLGLQIIAPPNQDRQLIADASTILAHAQFKEN